MSSIRFNSVDALPDRWRDQAIAKLGTMPARSREQKQRKSKYGAQRVTVDGIAFDSKRESRRYLVLKDMHASGEIKRFHRQVIFDLDGGIIYRCDFQVFKNDGSVSYQDSKGVSTKEFKIKMRLLRAKFGIEVELV